jgi:UDPglucose--hexose-1-phosphate uridylyltransferase
MSLPQRPHRRQNLLTGEWLLVSPQRALRPWQGQQEAPQRVDLPHYDAHCYLCPGNTRANGQQNPAYQDVYAFQNDFSAIEGGVAGDFEESIIQETNNGLLVFKEEIGYCEVICFSPRHDLTLAQMDVAGVHRVVELWCARFAALAARPEISHVQIFENKGAAMGCSNPHPHGQIWAQSHVPDLPAREGVRQATYFAEKGRVLLLDYLATELAAEERIVLENEHFAVVVPFWAAWPFETLVLPKRHIPDLSAMTAAEQHAFADAIRRITCRYDNLFQSSFPYSAGIHQAPCDGAAHPGWQLHMHFFPPLLRSASVKKFMVGYEMLAEPQRDISAESAAERLRHLPDVHYSQHP